jgi:hypothetical protein
MMAQATGPPEPVRAPVTPGGSARGRGLEIDAGHGAASLCLCCRRNRERTAQGEQSAPQ